MPRRNLSNNGFKAVLATFLDELSAKNGYLYNKKDLNIFDSFYTYGGRYEVEHRDAKESDLLE